jgi:hypothetical protein
MQNKETNVEAKHADSEKAKKGLPTHVLATSTKVVHTDFSRWRITETNRRWLNQW